MSSDQTHDPDCDCEECDLRRDLTHPDYQAVQPFAQREPKLAVAFAAGRSALKRLTTDNV